MCFWNMQMLMVLPKQRRHCTEGNSVGTPWLRFATRRTNLPMRNTMDKYWPTIIFCLHVRNQNDERFLTYTECVVLALDLCWATSLEHWKNRLRKVPDPQPPSWCIRVICLFCIWFPYCCFRWVPWWYSMGNWLAIANDDNEGTSCMLFLYIRYPNCCVKLKRHAGRPCRGTAISTQEPHPSLQTCQEPHPSLQTCCRCLSCMEPAAAWGVAAINCTFEEAAAEVSIK